ncbi:hypothetical protein Trydic_g8306 [Trypoxylus dichotomus]
MKVNVISVYSKVPKLINSLQSHLPSIKFKQIVSTNDKDLRQPNVLIIDVPVLLPILNDISNAKFIHITRAGVDQLINYVKQNGRLPCCPVVRYTGPIYAALMAEYVIHRVVHYERDFERIRNNQQAKIWSLEGKVRAYRTVSDLKIGILGVGYLGFGIAKILHSLGATIYAFRRSTGELPDIYTSVFHGKDQLPEFLRICDYIVSVLPETEDTIGLLNNGVLEHCKDKNAVFISVGRGSIINEQELIRALKNNWLQAAFLDVFPTEPLPKDSALWTTPNVTITPHVAAYNRAQDIAKAFKMNLELFQQRKPMIGLIDFEKGY